MNCEVTDCLYPRESWHPLCGRHWALMPRAVRRYMYSYYRTAKTVAHRRKLERWFKRRMADAALLSGIEELGHTVGGGP